MIQCRTVSQQDGCLSIYRPPVILRESPLSEVHPEYGVIISEGPFCDAGRLFSHSQLLFEDEESGDDIINYVFKFRLNDKSECCNRS